jgi:hypothetical protein
MKFFPLTLGVPQGKTREERESERSPRTYDDWREWVGPQEEFEPFPAEDILLRLTQGDPALPRRPWLILGEPGAGKTRLLEHWHATWVQALLRPYLGMKVPVLVRLRDVPRDAFKGDPSAVADTLWDRGLAVGWSQARGTAAEAVFALHSHVFTPVWLLDGLDELASPIADRGLWHSLRALPGEAALTCRTAVFQAARAEIKDLIATEWRILGLKPTPEQVDFLAEAYADEKIDPACAEEMVRDLNANASLRSLAASPLILRLVAEAGPRLKLPATRASFYEAATNALWERRLRDRPELIDLAPERDATLAKLAATMGLAATEAPKGALHQTGARPDLREALRQSGLLTFNDRWNQVGFRHLTFQEYHLARAFLPRPFRDVLNDYWSDARYEETLALLVALHAGEGRARMVEAELCDFVASDLPRPRLLGRSPLRTILHLLSRAAVSPSIALPIELKDQPGLLRLAIACDPLTPTAALAELARDPNWEVRREVAGNPATLAATLAELARDPTWEVWEGVVTRKPVTPEVELAALRGHWDPAVRRRVAESTATPTALRAELARNPDAAVRGSVAGNPAMPAALLAELARDPDAAVRRTVAGNAATPAALLAELARDPDAAVRWRVAGNAAIPAALLAELARDPDALVRRTVAGSPAMPAALLAELVHDPDPAVRRWVAGNAATPAALLAELARDPDEDVRRSVAENAATPAALLAELARDPDATVRRSVAGIPAMPATLLAELARDPDAAVRGSVAGSPAMPAALLAELAHDADAAVRWWVAGNAATPAALLAELARDADANVRRWVAGSPATSAALLAELAHDPDAAVRQRVAGSTATPAALLAELARDPDEGVRWEVVRNAQVLLEDLARQAPKS